MFEKEIETITKIQTYLEKQDQLSNIDYLRLIDRYIRITNLKIKLLEMHENDEN